MKWLVAGCVFLNTAQIAAISYTVYFWMIVCRTPANYPFLGTLGQGLVVVPAYLTYFLATAVQCFYAMRVWFVSGKNLWLTGAIVVLSIIQLAGGFALVSYMVTQNTIVSVYSRFNHIAGGIELAASILCDMIISISLVILLRKNRDQVFRGTRHAVDRLILYSINIGLLANAVVIANLITWLVAPETDFTWAVFHFSLGKVYVNSMLVSLNARKKIRHDLSPSQGYVQAATSTFDVFDGTSTVAARSAIEMKDLNNIPSAF